MHKKKRVLSGLLATVITLSLFMTQAFAASFNPVVDTITSVSDSRISTIHNWIAVQNFTSPSLSRVQTYVSYLIGDYRYSSSASKYSALSATAWPYTNEGGYVSTVTDGTYTISGINGSGCFAYSKWVMNVIYGKTGAVLAEGESAGALTAGGLQSFLRKNAQAGEQIRLGNIHSVTFLACDANGFYYTDYWGGVIRLHYTTFAKFASACNAVTSSVPLWLYNANTNVNDTSKQPTDSSEPDAGTESTLLISPTAYPSGQLIVGNYYNLTGAITSNYNITSIVGTIYTEGGTLVSTKSAVPNAKAVDIRSSAINNLSFGSLEIGNYYLQYSATDSSGKTVMWTSDIFSVVSSESTLAITPEDYPTGQVLAKAFTLTGTITSNYNLTSVSAYLSDTSGNVLYTVLVTNVGATSFNIKNSRIDNSLPFGSLDLGSYYLVYEASDATGNSVSWTSPVFQVVSSLDNNAGGDNGNTDNGGTQVTESLKITPTAYPRGNIAARGYSIYGSITSGSNITSVVAQIVSSDGVVQQQVTDAPNTTTYDFKTKIDTLSVGSLKAGYYYLYVSAADAAGNTAEWTSDIFAVSPKTLFADVSSSGAWYYEKAYALASMGIMSGSLDDGILYFNPEQGLTRAQAVTLFYNLYTVQYGTPVVSGTNPFEDVSSNAWYASYINWGYSVGLVSGTSDITFSPDQQITRQELARMILNYAVKFAGVSEETDDYLAGYTDAASVAGWAASAVNWCIQEGIYSSISTEELSFAPVTVATRAQCAALFYNVQDKLG